jgi:hypothetical protein
MRRFLVKAKVKAGHETRLFLLGGVVGLRGAERGRRSICCLTPTCHAGQMDGIRIGGGAPPSSIPGSRFMLITGFAAVAASSRIHGRPERPRFLSKPCPICSDLVAEVERMMAALTRRRPYRGAQSKSLHHRSRIPIYPRRSPGGLVSASRRYVTTLDIVGVTGSIQTATLYPAISKISNARLFLRTYCDPGGMLCRSHQEMMRLR